MCLMSNNGSNKKPGGRVAVAAAVAYRKIQNAKARANRERKTAQSTTP